MGAARPYIGQVTCQGEGALQQGLSVNDTSLGMCEGGCRCDGSTGGQIGIEGVGRFEDAAW
jgi:hypothetical protein